MPDHLCNAAEDDLNQANVVLALCARGELTLKELCECTMYSKSTASRIVEELVEQKKLDRTVPPENRRTIKISVNKRFLKQMEKINGDPELQEALSRSFTQEEGFAAVHILAEGGRKAAKKTEKKKA